jgi:uncharacterized protein (TIRG00374 family)
MDRAKTSSTSRALVYCGAFAALYALAIAYTGFEAVVEGFGAVGPVGWAVLLLLSLVNYVLRLWRWGGFLRYLGHRVGLGYRALTYFAGFAFTATPGKAGEAVRLAYLRPYGVGYAHGTATLVSERILDIVVVGLLALPAVYFLPQVAWVVSVAGLIVAIVIATISSGSLLRRLDGVATRTPHARLATVLRGVAEAVRSARSLLRGRVLASGLLLGAVAWAAEGYGLYLITVWLDQPIDVALAMAIYALAMLAGAVSFLPGGLGTAEAAMVVLLSISGVPLAEATAATIVCRIATLWFAMALGVVASAWLAISVRYGSSVERRV